MHEANQRAQAPPHAISHDGRADFLRNRKSEACWAFGIALARLRLDDERGRDRARAAPNTQEFPPLGEGYKTMP